MAKRLTEEMVIARSKFSDLSKVKRLNCWGSELVDVSVLRKMPCVEVLSLSINKINSLADFQYCLALQELYIRQNDIRDLNQICYLQGLPGLKHLWLGENPCAATEEYRLTVLRTLPQIQKLDNVVVTQDELREASRKGRVLCHPEDPQESEEDEYPSQNQQWYQEYAADKEYSPQRSPPQHEPDYENEETKDYYSRDDGIIENRDYSPPQSQASPPRRQEPHRQSYSPEEEYTDKRTNNYDQEYSRSTQCYDKSPPNNNNFHDESVEINYRDIKLTSSQSTTSIKDFTNGEKYSSSQQSYRHSDGIELSAHLHDISQRPREKFTCPATHQPPFNRRPVTRNSNILSAVLCLVKELDYPSLEVVEMAVRCRMDELEE